MENDEVVGYPSAVSGKQKIHNITIMSTISKQLLRYAWYNVDNKTLFLLANISCGTEH